MIQFCALYARVSTEEQSRGMSIETQLDAGRKNAAEHQWPVYKEYIDPGYSATSDQRPDFQKMVRDALNGKFQAIIVYSFDRFARNMEHAVIYKNMLRRDGIQVVSVIEPIDQSSPFAFMHEGIVDLFAAYYSINLSAKIQAGLDKKIQAGHWPWPVPLGYLKDNGIAIVDPVAGPLMTQAFKEFSTGNYTLATWSTRAKDMGIRSRAGRHLSVSDWSRLFNNPFFTGILRRNGVDSPGQHPALVSLETWAQVQSILAQNRNNQTGSQQRFYLLKGLLWSVNAQSRMVGAVGKGYRYYRSTAQIPNAKKRHYVQSDTLEGQLPDVLADVYLDQSQTAPSELNEAVLLALRVASLGRVIEHLEDNDKRILLITAVTQLKVSDEKITDIEVKSPFFCEFDQPVVEMAGVEPASKKAGYKRLRV